MPLTRMRLTVGCLMAVCSSVSVCEAGKTYSQAPEISPSQTEEAPSEPKAASKLSQLLQEGPKPTWIWGADDNKPYQLSKSFETKAVSARLIATGDNHMSVSLNGNKVASSDTWEQPVEVDAGSSRAHAFSFPSGSAAPPASIHASTCESLNFQSRPTRCAGKSFFSIQR